MTYFPLVRLVILCQGCKHSAISLEPWPMATHRVLLTLLEVPSANQRSVVNQHRGCWYGWFKIPARFTDPTPCS
ncbi:MAG: hypothetical protein F6K44_13160 [Moorea sp. SIO3E2]|nr:hypothetical protein [Moorena sp. SIO3E2]